MQGYFSRWHKDLHDRRKDIAMILHSNQPGRAPVRPSFPQCAYALSSDPEYQNRCGLRINTEYQLQFLNSFVDGEWHAVSREDESRLIDGVLLELGWRFAYRPIYDDAEAFAQYQLSHWQIRLLRRLRRRFEEVFP
jgi:hypothetical protein